MILRDGGDGTVVAIGQASHAWLSGQLARAWGNDAFAAPDPWEELCLAAEQHDVGMALWDLAPDAHPQTGLPLQFFEVPRLTHLALWSAAPERLLSQSRHAALLVSLHGTGLYERFPPRDPPPDVARAIAAFHDGQHALQARLTAELRLEAAALRDQQQQLALWDDLSLALCGRQDRPAGHRLTVTTTHRDDGTVAVDPWPFRDPSLTVRCEGRRLRGPYAGAAVLHAALAGAELVPLRFALRPA